MKTLSLLFLALFIFSCNKDAELMEEATDPTNSSAVDLKKFDKILFNPEPGKALRLTRNFLSDAGFYTHPFSLRTANEGDEHNNPSLDEGQWLFEAGANYLTAENLGFRFAMMENYTYTINHAISEDNLTRLDYSSILSQFQSFQNAVNLIRTNEYREAVLADVQITSTNINSTDISIDVLFSAPNPISTPSGADIVWPEGSIACEENGACPSALSILIPEVNSHFANEAMVNDNGSTCYCSFVTNVTFESLSWGFSGENDTYDCFECLYTSFFNWNINYSLGTTDIWQAEDFEHYYNGHIQLANTLIDAYNQNDSTNFIPVKFASIEGLPFTYCDVALNGVNNNIPDQMEVINLFGGILIPIINEQ